jgi:hypothetical protein
MELEYNVLAIALITSLVGSLVRAFYEINNHTNSRTKLMFIIITAFAIAFLDYELSINFDIRGWVGIIGIVGGIIGIGLVKVAIEKMPDIVLDKVNRMLGGRGEVYGSGNEGSGRYDRYDYGDNDHHHNTKQPYKRK